MIKKCTYGKTARRTPILAYGTYENDTRTQHHARYRLARSYAIGLVVTEGGLGK